MPSKLVKCYTMLVLNFIVIKRVLCHSQCEINLIENLIPKGYAKSLPPSKIERKPTLVYVSIHVTDIDYIREEKMEYSMNLNFYEFWKDSRLNLSCFEVREQIPREIISEIWTPDIIFENLNNGYVHMLSVPNIVLWVVDYGYLNRVTRYNLRVNCYMDLRTYPMDTQDCYLYMDSLANSDLKMLLKWFHERKEKDSKIKDLEISDVQLLKYRLVSISSGSKCEAWPNGNYTTLHAKFTFERRLSSHIFNFYIPSGLVVLLSSLTFWYSLKSVSSRLSVGLTSLLTLSTQSWEAHSGLPAISYLTALDIWLFSCVIQVFLTLITYTVIYNLSRKKPCKKKFNHMDYKTPSNIRWKEAAVEWNYIKNGVGGAKKSVDKKNRNNSVNDDGESNYEPETDVEYLDKICRYLFPIGFAIFTTIYWIYYLA